MKDMCLTPVDFTKKLINYCISSFASFSVKVTNVVSGEFLVMVIQSSKSWAIPFGWNLIVSIKAPVSGSDQLLYKAMKNVSVCITVLNKRLAVEKMDIKVCFAMSVH